MRSTISINQGWKFIKTADNVVHAMQQVGEAVPLPHTWNAQDGQDGDNNYHRGTCWYIRELEKPVTDGEVYLEVNGAAMTAVIYLN